MRVAVAVACIMAAASVTLPASAQPKGDPTAAAEDLFQRGKAMMTAGRFAEACPLLAESYRLDPAGGTLQNLAVCYESSGKWASAWARFQELRAISKTATPPRADRIKLADEHLEHLKPKVLRVIVAAAEPTTRMEITIDGVVYQQASWTAGIPVDPGDHILVASAPGKEAFRTALITGDEGGEQRVKVPALKDLPAASLMETRRSVDENAERARAEQERERARRAEADRKLRTIGLVTGGAGLVVLATGAVFGALAITKNNDGTERCHPGPGTSDPEFDPAGDCFVQTRALQEANDAKSDARVFANVANVLVPLGLVATGVGVYLVLSRPSGSGPSVRASAAAGRLSLEGRF